MSKLESIGKTTGFMYADGDLSEKELFVMYTRNGELETLTIGDGESIQFSVSYRVVKKIIEQAVSD